MHSFATLVLACCVGPIAVQAVAQSGNPNNTVPYGAQAGAPPSAQAPPTHAAPAETTATYTGCVRQSPTDKTVLILSTESACAKLTGTFTATQLDGHEVDLKGVLTPRTSTLPASLKVDAVLSVGKACSDVCSLRPPKSRGLGKGGEIPGRQGGTPGEAPTQPPPVP